MHREEKRLFEACGLARCPLSSDRGPATLPGARQSIVGRAANPTLNCADFLQSCALPQYEECLIKNIGVVSGLIDRRKLEKLRLHQLPQMNITQFDHMKTIMRSIKGMKHDTHEKQARRVSTTAASNSTSPPRRTDERPASAGKGTQPQRQSSPQRPHTRGASASGPDPSSRLGRVAPVGANFAHFRRTESGTLLDHVESQLQEGGSYAGWGGGLQGRIRPLTAPSDVNEGDKQRWSSGQHDAERVSSAREARARSCGYGNQAVRKNSVEAGVRSLTKVVVEQFRAVVRCDRATIMFNDAATGELVFFLDKGQAIRFPNLTGIAGYCLQTGEALNIEDAYADPRFNRDIDKKTGYRTRNILARPIYARDSSNVIAIIEMINKLDGTSFTKQDEQLLESCCHHVSDALEDRFTDLLISLAALNTNRRSDLVSSSTLHKDIKALASLHDAFKARLETKKARGDSRYMRVTTPGQGNDLSKRKRRREYAETLRGTGGLEAMSPTSPTRQSAPQP